MASIRNRLMIGLGFGLLVTAALMFWSDFSELLRTLTVFRWECFAGALLCTLVNYALRGLKWHYYVRLVGGTDLPFWKSLRLFVAGFPLAVTPGKVGEALKAFWLSEQSAVSFARGLPVVFAERLSDGIAVLLLSTFGVIGLPFLWPAFLLIAVAAILVIGVIQIRPLALTLLGIGERLPWIGPRMRAIHEMYEASYVLFRPAPLSIAVGIGTVSWMAEGVGFWLILAGLGLPATGASLGTAVFVLAFSTIVGSASAMPGGLGAAEASITGLLLATETAEPALAGAATLLIRMATLWFGVAIGLAVWAISPSLWRRSNEPIPVGGAHVAG